MKELLRCSHWRISSSLWTYTNSCLPRRVQQAASSRTWFLELLLILKAGAINLERDMECLTQFRPLWTTYKKVQSLCNRTWSATKNNDNLANSNLPILKWTKSNVRSWNWIWIHSRSVLSKNLEKSLQLFVLSMFEHVAQYLSPILPAWLTSLSLASTGM